MKIPITVIILTYNEELNLEKTLQAVKDLAGEIIIVDSFSTDSTENIAKNYGTVFYQNSFVTHAQQWNFALRNISLKNEWILGIDADQVLSQQLKEQLIELFNNRNELIKYQGIYVKKRNFFLGKRIRFGGVGEINTLKLFKKDAVYLDENELVDHHFYVKGNVKYLSGWINDRNEKDNLKTWLVKHAGYAELQAREEISKSLKVQFKWIKVLTDRQVRILFIKLKIWGKLPVLARPFIYFLYRYFILLGFLDGGRGLIFHLLQGFAYNFYVSSFIYDHKKKK